ncbi:glutathione S-transferase family protein [Ponticaulis profundi]|uniref:Glutathione S-transferase family protein n=1 Tax=Ponticaulis profundi TaxID=2665222 RepID=A0ABW1SBR4_9PROT
MRKLFHWPLDPAGRLVRLVLAEKQLDVDLVVSPPWKPAEEVKRLMGDSLGPVLLDQGMHGRVIANQTHAIIEFLEETYTDVKLLPPLPADRAEARRIWRRVENRFDSDINGSILAERIAQAVQRASSPDSGALRTGAHALRGMLTLLNGLCEQRSFLAGRQMSIADFAAAAQLSSLDYFGDVPWDSVPELRSWYSRIKSRPCFRGLLADRLTGTQPVRHYADLDF